jgi:hypothetical protein
MALIIRGYKKEKRNAVATIDLGSMLIICRWCTSGGEKRKRKESEKA